MVLFREKIRVFVVEEEALNRTQNDKRREKILLLVVIYLHTKTHANTYYLTDTIKLLLTDKFKKEQQTVRHNL